jgi:hypothetical protein
MVAVLGGKGERVMGRQGRSVAASVSSAEYDAGIKPRHDNGTANEARIKLE